MSADPVRIASRSFQGAWWLQTTSRGCGGYRLHLGYVIAAPPNSNDLEEETRLSHDRWDGYFHAGLGIISSKMVPPPYQVLVSCDKNPTDFTAQVTPVPQIFPLLIPRLTRLYAPLHTPCKNPCEYESFRVVNLIWSVLTPNTLFVCRFVFGSLTDHDWLGFLVRSDTIAPGDFNGAAPSC